MKIFGCNIQTNDALPPDTMLLVSPSSVSQQPDEDQRAYAERLVRERRVVMVQTDAQRAKELYTAYQAKLDLPEVIPPWESLTAAQQKFVIEYLSDE